MMRYFFLLTLSTALVACAQSTNSSGDKDTRHTVSNNIGVNTIEGRVQSPEGFVRTEVDSNSFAQYLRSFELKSKNSKVYYYNGKEKPNQTIHIAVFDIDVGTRDLQQCADAVMRLRAEYLYSQERFEEISFNFISDGKPRYFLDYSSGKTDYHSFRKYMNYIFSYANTRSLYGQMNKVDFADMQIGDVFIQTGNPYGHAVIVVDMVENPSNGKKLFLLAQSYMPAQDIHILVNPKSVNYSPWYNLNQPEDEVLTPEWNFKKEDLRRFE